MPSQNVALYAFNAGIASPLALTRVDLERLAISAQTFNNYMPRNLGSMMLRPGTAYIGATAGNAQAVFIPFVYGTNDTALIEVTNLLVRVWIDDALVTRPSVSSSVANSAFNSDLTSWTDNDDAGGTSAWVTGGYMGLTGNGTAAAIREQQITVAAGDQNVEHALSIVIERGPVTLRVGSTSGDDDYIAETSLESGYHSLTLTPTGNFFIEFSSRLKRQVLVDSCSVEASGTMTIVAPWATADLSKMRYDQSGDIVFIAADGYQQYKIERRSTRSWSVVKYEANDGPFRSVNIGPTTITPSAISGNVTLTASAPLFKSTNVGGLYRLTSSGQTVTASVTAENSFTNAIKVTGVGASRIFTIVRSGTWTATVTLQRSLDSSTGPWEDVTTYSTNATITYDDSLDNQIAWYRIGVKTGDFTSGTVELTLSYAIGSIDGIVRITAYTSSTSVSAGVIADLGNTSATDNWSEGAWSTRRGFPSAVSFVEGRLAWSGNDGIWLSVSDGFYSFDDTVIGDSAPINRTIGAGPVDKVHWILASQQMLLGTEGAEFACRSSSEDEPLTATNFNIKAFSTQGSQPISALKIDKNAVFVQRGGTRLFEMGIGGDFKYEAADLNLFSDPLGTITKIAIQRQPDTRVHCVLDDGSVAILVYDKQENVICWLTYSTDGSVEDVAVLPGGTGDEEDAVYYIVNRTINGSTVRYLEKWALEAQCQGGSINRQADSFITYTGAGSTTITGLSHLEGETVVVWGNGKDLGTKIVTSGQITELSEAVTNACVGLGYTGQWQSTKLAYASNNTALAQKKTISQIGTILYNTHYQGLKYGPDFTNLFDLPQVKDGTTTAADTIYAAYDEEAFEFPGQWDPDSRLCLQSSAPRPCTLLGLVLSMTTSDKR